MAARKNDDTEKVLVAKAPIHLGGFLAHNPGDEVPAANVEANGWQELVEERPAADAS